MSRGMRAIRKTAKEHEANNTWLRYLRKIEDGETATLLFIGTAAKEPFIRKKHSVNFGMGRFGSITCIDNPDTDDKCVACYAQGSGDDRVGRAGPSYSWSVFDFRWFKKILNKVKTKKAGKDRFDLTAVDESEVTERGIAKGVYVRGGACAYELAPQWAQALDGVNEKAMKRCKNCGGKISSVGYQDGEGEMIPQRAVDKLSEEHLLDKLADGEWEEVFECSKCDDPLPKSIFNSLVEVTRTGTDKKTSYQFTIVDDDIPEDEELAKAEPLDFEKGYSTTTEGQATALKMKNPYSGGKRRHSDDDEDEDETEDYDDEDEEDEVFEDDEEEEEADEEEERPRKKVTKKKVTKKKPVKLRFRR